MAHRTNQERPQIRAPTHSKHVISWSPETTTGPSVLCFGSAAAGAAWARPLGIAAPQLRILSVRLPGREALVRCPPLGDIEAITNLVASECRIDARFTGDLTLFGDCFGALVAWRVARNMWPDSVTLRRLVMMTPEPTHPSKRSRVHDAPSDLLWDHIRRTGLTDPRIIASAEMRDVLEPAFRADYKASETFAVPDESPLDLPATILACSPDSADHHLTGWRERFAGPFEVSILRSVKYSRDYWPELAAILAADSRPRAHSRGQG